MTRLRPSIISLALAGCLALVAASGAMAAGPPVLVSSPEVADYDGVTAQGLIPSVSQGGRYVGYVADDSAAGTSIYLRDMLVPAPIPVAVSSGSEELGYDADSPGLSSDGRYMVFASEDPTLSDEDVDFDRGPLGEPTGNPNRDVFVYDRATRTISLVSRRSGARGAAANDNSNLPAISADGRYVAFASKATNLVKGDDHRVEDVFLRDLKTDRTTLVSRAAGAHGAAGGGDSSRPAISADGRYVAFQSYANNLGPNDDGAATDVFVKDMKSGRVYLASAGAGGRAANGPSGDPGISADGHSVVFVSKATNLNPEDTDRRMSVFKYRVP